MLGDHTHDIRLVMQYGMHVQKPSSGWAQNGVRHAKTHSAAFRDEAVRTSGAEGPLGVGLVLQSEFPMNFAKEGLQNLVARAVLRQAQQQH